MVCDRRHICDSYWGVVGANPFVPCQQKANHHLFFDAPRIVVRVDYWCLRAVCRSVRDVGTPIYCLCAQICITNSSYYSYNHLTCNNLLLLLLLPFHLFFRSFFQSAATATGASFFCFFATALGRAVKHISHFEFAEMCLSLS